MSHDVESAGPDGTASRIVTVESVLAELDSVDADVDPSETSQILSSAAAVLRPTSEFPGTARELELLGEVYERTGLEQLSDDPEEAVASFYRAAVVGLLLGDGALRLRCLEIAAELQKANGNLKDAAVDYRAIAAAYTDTDAPRAEQLRAEATAIEASMVDGAGDTEEDATDIDDITDSETAPDAPEPPESTEATDESEAPDTSDPTEAPTTPEAEPTSSSTPSPEPPSEDVPSPPAPIPLKPEMIQAALAEGVVTFDRTSVGHRNAADVHARLMEQASAEPDKSAARTLVTDAFAQHWSEELNTAISDIAEGRTSDADWRFRYLIEAQGFADGPSEELVGRAWLGRVQLCLPSSPTLRNVVVEAANFVTTLTSTALRARLALDLAEMLDQIPGPQRIRRQLLDGASTDFRSLGNESEVLRCQLAKASDLALAKNYREAHDMLTGIASRARQVQDLPLYADVLLQLGKSWAFAGRPDGAVACFDRILKHFHESTLHDAREAEGYGKLALERGKVMEASRLPVTDPSETPRKYYQLAYEVFSRFGLSDGAEAARRHM